MNQYTSTILPKSRHLQPEKTWQKCKVSGSCPKYSTSRTNGTTPPPTALNSEPGLSSGSCMPAVEKNLPLGEPI